MKNIILSLILIFITSGFVFAESYTVTKSSDGVNIESIKRDSDSSYLSINLENRDYRKYIKWLNDGNTPTIILNIKTKEQKIAELKLEYLGLRADVHKYKDMIADRITDYNVAVTTTAIKARLVEMKAEWIILHQ